MNSALDFSASEMLDIIEPTMHTAMDLQRRRTLRLDHVDSLQNSFGREFDLTLDVDGRSPQDFLFDYGRTDLLNAIAQIADGNNETAIRALRAAYAKAREEYVDYHTAEELDRLSDESGVD